MPTYEYLCQACGHRFEKWQKMVDEPLTECPECGGHIRRVLFPAGIVFKGNGFYKTDHGNGSMPASGEAAKSDDAAAKNGGTNGNTPSSSGGENSSSTKTSESSASASNSATSKS
jgi:putative FmdB family regulatory protein